MSSPGRLLAPLSGILAWFILAPSLGAAERAAPKPIRALLVCGGCCHDYTRQKELIAKGLAERAHIEVTAVQQGGTATNSKIALYEKDDWAKDYDIVIHDECFSDVNDPEYIARILRPHKEGLPALVLHCAMHSYRDGSDNWFKFCGVTSRRHGAAYPHEVVNLDPIHPIMSKFGPAWANPAGELYWIEKVWDTAQPLASSKNKEKGNEEVCVWTNTYGDKKTRIFGTTLGHHNETVGAPEYLDLLARGTLWAVDKLNADYLKDAGKPKEVPVDEARGKGAKASSEQPDNFARNAFDGNPATRWCASGPQHPEWLQVDLGGPIPVTGVAIEWEQAETAYRYKLEGSKDGATWGLLTDASQNDRPGPYKHELKAPGTRFVRVTFLGSNGGWGSIREFQVFGDRTTTLDPAAAAKAAEAAFLKDVKLPEGFEATLFAAPPAVNYPTFVAAAPNGDLYVSVDKNGSLDRQPHRGAVLRLRDLDGDGRADEVRPFVSDVDSPRGLVWDQDRLYLMHPPHLSAYLDHDGDGRADEEKVLVKDIAFGFKDRPADHTSNGVTLGIDGWLYLAIGDFGFMNAVGADGRQLQLRGGGVVRVRPDGSGLELYARGTRNILEVSVDPLLNAFARDNTNDGGGWDIRLHHFSGLEDHGYPSRFKNFTDEVIAPLADYGGGSGCGGLFLDEPGFPEGYGHALYTADWGRERVFRHLMTPKGATFEADQAEFLALPRVTDLDVDAQGRIYAASWKGASFTYVGEDVGYLVRIVPKGYRPRPLPDFDRASDADLVGILANDESSRRRLEAQRTLTRRGLKGGVSADLQSVASHRAKAPANRVAAIFALKQGLGAKATPILAELATDPTVGIFAVRALTDRDDQLDGIPAEPILGMLKSSSAAERREAAVSLARLARGEHAAALTPLLADPDPVVSHTTVQALIRLQAAEAAFAVVDNPAAPAAARVGALRVLQSLHDPKVVAGLIGRLDAEQNAARRRGLLAALCRLHDREGPWKGDSWGTRPDTSGPYYQAESWEATPAIAAALKSALERETGEDQAFLLAELGRHKIRLDGALERVIALARDDASLLPTAIDQLARADRIPDEGLPLLIKTAEAETTGSAVRSAAIRALLKTERPEAVQAVLAALARFKAGDGDLERARDALLGSNALGRHVALLDSEAARLDGPRSAWADAALLAVAGSKSASPESRAEAAKVVDAAWASSPRRAQILKAIGLANRRADAEKVLAALDDADAAVAAAARQTAATLKLSRQPNGARGPKLETLSVDNILAAIEKAKGNRELGEQVFARQNCNQCHTVRQDEAARGPYLGNIAKTYKRRDLAEAILLPSKTIAQGFVTNVFALGDGRTLTGFVVQEAADKVTIRDAEGKEIDIPTQAIDERAKTAVSVMPDGLVKTLTLTEFASLLDYLEALGQGK